MLRLPVQFAGKWARAARPKGHRFPAALIHRGTANMRWAVLADWEPDLFDHQGLRLDRWASEGAVRVVKSGSHRRVWHVELADRAFYVKQYRRQRLIDALQQLVRRSPAVREWHNTLEVGRRGIATVRPVAWAEVLRGGLARESFLVTEAVPGARSLDAGFECDRPRQVAGPGESTSRQRLESLARFVATIHQAGVRHPDFHLGNLLERPGLHLPSGDIRLLLIDLPNVGFGKPLNWPTSRANLAMLVAGCLGQVTPRSLLPFWQAYLAARPELEVPEPEPAWAQLERESGRYARRVGRRRDRRVWHTNRHYVLLAGADRRVSATRDLSQKEHARLFDDPESLVWEGLDRPVKLSHGTVVVEATLPLGRRTARVAYKWYRPRNRWKALLGRIRRGRARRGWMHGHALCARHIATPRPVVVCDLLRPRYARTSFLATEWIEGALNLHLYGWQLAKCEPVERLRRASRCARTLGQLVGKMHAWQISHGDLKASNLLVVESGQNVRGYVIDVDGVRIRRRLSNGRRVADLARLATSLRAHRWVTPAVLCRFLAAYLEQLPPESVAWKPLWRQVARRSDRIVRRKRARGETVL